MCIHSEIKVNPCVLQKKISNSFSLTKIVVVWFSSLKFIPRGPIDTKIALGQVMASHRRGDKSLPGPILSQCSHVFIRALTILVPILKYSVSSIRSMLIHWLFAPTSHQWSGSCRINWFVFHSKDCNYLSQVSMKTWQNNMCMCLENKSALK